MNCLLIHQAFISPQGAGGTRHWEFAQRLMQGGHRFMIVASDLSYLSGTRVLGTRGLVTRQDLDGITVLRAYTYPALHRSFAWRVVSFLSFMVTSLIGGWRAGRVDIVMGTSPPIFQAVSAWLIAALRRRPFLFEVRDLWPDFAIDMGVVKNRWLIRASRWLEMFLYRRATHILVNSPAYRQIIAAKGIPESKISVIPNGVDPEMFDPNARGASVRQRWDVGEKFLAVYAGALGLANDIPTILRAAALLKSDDDIRVLLVGDGKERPRLEAAVRKDGLANVIFAGSQPKAEMREYLAAADVCLATLQNIPMFRTTYPNKVFDYMAAGRPTLLAIDGVIREVIEQSQGGIFVPPGDADALAAAVREMKRDPERRSRMGLMARAHVCQHFNRRDHAEQLLHLMESLRR